MLKVGDKLLCKKTYEHNRFEGKYYTITGIDNECVYFVYFVDNGCWPHSLSDVGYSLNSNGNWYIWNYFYTPQEMRKLKLKQLNDVESR